MSRIIDGVVAGHIIRSPEQYERYFGDVSSFVHHLALLGFRDDELPRPISHASRIQRLVEMASPLDDIVNFFMDIRWSQTVVEETIYALNEMGAEAHARLLGTLHSYLSSIGYATAYLTTDVFCEAVEKANKDPNFAQLNEIIERAIEDCISSDVLQRRYGNFSVGGDQDWNCHWYLIYLHAINYLINWTNLKRVPQTPSDADLTKYFLSNPASAQRLKEIENASPWELPGIECTMERLGRNLLKFQL